MIYYLSAFVQEIGRAGRDLKPAESLVYFNNSDLGPNVKQMSDDMRDYCRATGCRRQLLATHFGYTQSSKINPIHCCDNCGDIDMDTSNQPLDLVCEEELDQSPHDLALRCSLENYVLYEQSCGLPYSSLTPSFGNTLIDSVVRMCKRSLCPSLQDLVELDGFTQSGQNLQHNILAIWLAVKASH